MNRQQLIFRLKEFRNRLKNDVGKAYFQRGSSFGNERFMAWRRQIGNFLDENLPGENERLNQKLTHIAYFRNNGESDHDVFMREDGEPSFSFIDSLLIDIENGEYDFAQKDMNQAKNNKNTKSSQENSDRVFIVHGHDELLKNKAARFVEKLGLKAIILHEQASKGRTIIEKIEEHTEVGFAIVLYTPDDAGATQADANAGALKPRARQNVVFEHGYLIAKLSRARVVPLVSGEVELPSDISGMVYVDGTNWENGIAKEMKAAGYPIDLNKLID